MNLVSIPVLVWASMQGIPPDPQAAAPPTSQHAAGAVEELEALPVPIEEEWGVEIISIRATAQGRMIDFRYRVLDAQKAARLFERKTHPYLIDRNTGKVLAVPRTAKVGPLRNSNMPIAGKTYWMFFDNVQQLVKPGSMVDVVIGDFKAASLKVR
jgi:hypothetical protein